MTEPELWRKVKEVVAVEGRSARIEYRIEVWLATAEGGYVRMSQAIGFRPARHYPNHALAYCVVADRSRGWVNLAGRFESQEAATQWISEMLAMVSEDG